jgi:hypothetical protein
MGGTDAGRRQSRRRRTRFHSRNRTRRTRRHYGEQERTPAKSSSSYGHHGRPGLLEIERRFIRGRSAAHPVRSSATSARGGRTDVRLRARRQRPGSTRSGPLHGSSPAGWSRPRAEDGGSLQELDPPYLRWKRPSTTSWLGRTRKHDLPGCPRHQPGIGRRSGTA